MEDAGARYLRGNQKGRNHGRHADKSQELINRKHARRPPFALNPHPPNAPTSDECQNRTATCCSWRVRIWSEITAPEIVSSARSVMTVMVCIWLTSRRIVAENVRAWFLFRTKAGNNRDRRSRNCGDGIGLKYRREAGALPLPWGEGWGEGLRSLGTPYPPHPHR